MNILESAAIFSRLTYVNVEENWPAIKKAMDSKSSRRVLNSAMSVMCEIHYPRFQMPKNGLQPYKYPQRGDALDEMTEQNPELRKYYRYCSGGSCHWSAYFHLDVCRKVFPEDKWIILAGKKHSTVYSWTCDKVFEMFYYFSGVSPQDAWLKANDELDSLWDLDEVSE